MNKKRIITTYEKLTAPLRAMYNQTLEEAGRKGLILVNHVTNPFYAMLLETEEMLYLVKMNHMQRMNINSTEMEDDLFEANEYSFPVYDD